MSSLISDAFKKEQMHALLDSMDLGALLRLGLMLHDRGLMNLTRALQVPCESLCPQLVHVANHAQQQGRSDEGCQRNMINATSASGSMSSPLGTVRSSHSKIASTQSEVTLPVLRPRCFAPFDCCVDSVIGKIPDTIVEGDISNGSFCTREHSMKSASETNSDLQSKSFGKKAHHFINQFPQETPVPLCKSACELDQASAESCARRFGIEPPEDVELPRTRQVRLEKSHRGRRKRRSMIASKNLENADVRMAPTTMMISDLPFKLSKRELLQEMDLLNFSGTYDYVRIIREGNVNYAFVNFRTAEKAKEFAAAFEGHSFKKYDQENLTSVRVASRQSILE